MKKNILITGASKGIGQAIAQTLGTDNYHLILIASNLDSFTEKNPNITYLAADFTSFDAIDAVAAEITKQFDHIDVLINNLGMYIGKPLVTTEQDEFHRLMDVNFSGPAYFTHKILPLLNKGTHAQIINMSSIAAIKHLPEMSVYAASKGAMTWFSNSLRIELNKQGTRVTVLHPGGVNTWNDPHPESLLHPTDIGKTIKFIIEADPKCQIDEITITPVKTV
jgi:NADP-dependent 3-hydroxy acid dehydrogenase YdfG